MKSLSAPAEPRCCFRPLPLLKGAHRQTLFGYFSTRVNFPSETTIEAVDLGDGDQTTIHYCESEGVRREDSPTVLVLHGLEGEATRPYLVRIANKLHSHGFRTARMNMRCCGDAEGLSTRFYNSTLSEDVRSAARHLRSKNPLSPVYLLGFSLGANLVLKAAIEGDEPEEFAGVAAVSPPISLHDAADALMRRANRLYQSHFVKSLVARAKRHVNRFFPGRRYDLSPKMSVIEFDENWTAPISGFRNVDEYYHAGSVRNRLDRIRCPWVIFSAEDDPIVPGKMFESVEVNGKGRLALSAHGGHMGFLGLREPGDPDNRWAENRTVEFFARLAGVG